ncbi:MAG: hypothetical protein VYE40_18135 [Myxococcota bacterium]|jgi:hypothetical protein|nr:hypothetical protein [Myxococcota bacterium]MEC9443019.1 hypothetical protein [Myxococcota bacterium]
MRSHSAGVIDGTGCEAASSSMASDDKGLDESEVEEFDGEDSEDQLEAWPWDDDEVDPELVELGDAPVRDSVLRPILMLMVLVMGCFILSDWQEELAYFFSAKEAVQIGSVTDFPEKRAADPEWSPQMPHNRYVEVSGIGESPSLSKRYKYFKLIGGEVYIETLRDDAEASELEKLQKTGNERGDEPAEYFRFEAKGRALSFAAMPKRYATLRQYYSRYYNTTFCVDLDEGTRTQLERQQRDMITQIWKERYDGASAAEREKRGLTQTPTEEQVRERMEQRPVCVDAWLIQAHKSPTDHWWYLALASVFALFMLVDLIFLIRWIVRFLQPDDL